MTNFSNSSVHRIFPLLFPCCFRNLIVPQGQFPMELPRVGVVHSLLLPVSQILRISFELHAIWKSLPISSVCYKLLIYWFLYHIHQSFSIFLTGFPSNLRLTVILVGVFICILTIYFSFITSSHSLLLTRSDSDFSI